MRLFCVEPGAFCCGARRRVGALTSEALLRQLVDTPNDEALCRELGKRVVNHSYNDELSRAVNRYFEEAVPPGDRPRPPPVEHRPTWSNYIGEQVCYPHEIRKPTSLQDLIAAVQAGKASSLRVRVVGSGHSYSDVCPTDGILLDPHGMNKVLPINESHLKDPSLASRFFAVESGITISDLNEQLDSRRLALTNMGAFNNQTLAGAISTGTHGTGVTLGPLASSVRSLILVSESGTVYQLEPSDGVTDPAKFEPGPNNIVLKQNDDWFRTAVVAMGCVGPIYAYTIEVELSYFLKEDRTLSTWEDVKTRLQDGPAAPPLTQNRHFELDINPYADPLTRKHLCVQIVRNKHDGPAKGSRGFSNWLAGALSSWHDAQEWLVWFLNTFPTQSPALITRALDTLITPDPEVGYVDKGFKVMNLGAVNDVKAIAIELSFDASNNLVDQVDRLLSVLERAATERGWFMAGPMSLRFVAPSSALVAPQEGRVTCMVELDMLVGIRTGKDLLRFVKGEMCKQGNGVRVHWGLDLDTVTGEQAQDMYPQWPKWLAVYKQLNQTGMWNNKFTDRLGISVGR